MWLAAIETKLSSWQCLWRPGYFKLRGEHEKQDRPFAILGPIASTASASYLYDLDGVVQEEPDADKNSGDDHGDDDSARHCDDDTLTKRQRLLATGLRLCTQHTTNLLTTLELICSIPAIHCFTQLLVTKLFGERSLNTNIKLENNNYLFTLK